MAHSTKRARTNGPDIVPTAGPSSTSVKAAVKSKYQARLFAPFRALGYISNHVPFGLQVRAAKGALTGANVNIVSCLGRSWAMWDAAKMTLLFVGTEAPASITSLAISGNAIFAAAGMEVFRYHRGKVAATYALPNHSSFSTTPESISQILIFGAQLLVLPASGTALFAFDIESGDLEGQIDFQMGFEATTMLHPATYLNKVVVAGTDGSLQLWNVKTLSLIHTFPASTTNGANTPITMLTQSPAVDVIAAGHASGLIQILDLRSGDLLFSLKMEEGAISGLTFRMDGPPILASGSTNGTIAIWDLEQRGKVLHSLREAHESAVTGLQWVGGQPLLISSSGDNSIKQWVCDTDAAMPRLLKSRSGHQGPVNVIRYYGEDGKQILTAGRDRALRYTSVVRDSRSHELSQGSLTKKANNLSISVSTLKYKPITSIASSSTRSKDWEDVLTAHQDDSRARTWRVQDKKAGRWALDMENAPAKAVCVSACGNYGMSGSSNGEIRMWNMQSGVERKRFNLSGKVDAPVVKRKAATKSSVKSLRSGLSVTGLASDALNQTLVASTLDGHLYFFDFHTTALLQKPMKLSASITQITLNRDNGLLAVVCDDMAVRLVDIETRRVVREMVGPRARVLDLAFSADSRWLLTTSLDSIIRTYDTPTGQLIDAFRTPSIATSITFSPTGDFLATAHVDSVGVHLWANRAQFLEVPLRNIDEEDVQDAALPSVQGADEEVDIDGLEPVGRPQLHEIYSTPDQLEDGLVTLSLVPRSRWQTLLNLETIQQRNKPKEPPKAPEQAPFFLPTTTGGENGLQTRFDFTAIQDKDSGSKTRTDLTTTFLESEFTRRLGLEDSEGDYGTFFEYLKSLSPAAIDLEIRSLISLQHIESFLRALIGRLRSHRDFEAVQAVMSVCLNVHGDVLVENEELKPALQELLEHQAKESERIKELLAFTLGTLSFIRQGV